jgi:hypothetical protein
MGIQLVRTRGRRRRLLGATFAFVSLIAILAGAFASAVTAIADVSNPGPLTVTFTAGSLVLPAGPISLNGSATGTVDGDGNIALPQANITFDESDTPALHIAPAAAGEFAGTIDPDTGSATLDGAITVVLGLTDTVITACPMGPISFHAVAATGDAAYDPATGNATLTDNSLVIPRIPSDLPGCFAEGAQLLNSAFGLPSAPGDVTLTLPSNFSPPLAGSTTTSSKPSTTTSESSTTTLSSTTTSTVASSTTTTTVACKPGAGSPKKDACHTGPPGRNKP